MDEISNDSKEGPLQDAQQAQQLLDIFHDRDRVRDGQGAPINQVEKDHWHNVGKSSLGQSPGLPHGSRQQSLQPKQKAKTGMQTKAYHAQINHIAEQEAHQKLIQDKKPPDTLDESQRSQQLERDVNRHKLPPLGQSRVLTKQPASTLHQSADTFDFGDLRKASGAGVAAVGSPPQTEQVAIDQAQSPAEQLQSFKDQLDAVKDRFDASEPAGGRNIQHLSDFSVGQVQDMKSVSQSTEGRKAKARGRNAFKRSGSNNQRQQQIELPEEPAATLKTMRLKAETPSALMQQLRGEDARMFQAELAKPRISQKTVTNEQQSLLRGQHHGAVSRFFETQKSEQQIDDQEYPHNMCARVQQSLNEQPQYMGLRRVARPPVFAWSTPEYQARISLVQAGLADRHAETQRLLPHSNSDILAANPRNAASHGQSDGAIDTLGNQDKLEDGGVGQPHEIMERQEDAGHRQSLHQQVTPQGLGNPDFSLESREASELESNTFEAAHIKIMAITWNLQGQMPTYESLDELFQKDNVHHDMYAFGSQEALRPIAASMIMPSKERLNQMILDYFSDNLPEQKKQASERRDRDEPSKKRRKFTIVHANTLASTHLLVLARKDLASFISNVQSDQVAVGFGDLLANKGAVSISFSLGKLRLCFVNCHLAAHDEGLGRRNQQWNRVNDRFVAKVRPKASSRRSEGLFEPNYGLLEGAADPGQKPDMINCSSELPPAKGGGPDEINPSKSSNKKAKMHKNALCEFACLEKRASSEQRSRTIVEKKELVPSKAESVEPEGPLEDRHTASLKAAEEAPLQHFDAVIWCGDYNYRVTTSGSQTIMLLMQNGDWDVLQANDQLLIERKVKRVCLGYQEGPIYFAPTFKLEKGGCKYRTKRQPGWTDRILFRSNNRLLRQVNYDSNNLVRMSDHRPVFAQFMLMFDRKDKDNLNISQRNKDRARATLDRSAKKPPRAGHNKVVPMLAPQPHVPQDVSKKHPQLLEENPPPERALAPPQQPQAADVPPTPNPPQIVGQLDKPPEERQVDASLLESSVLVAQMVADGEEFRNFGDQKSQACTIY